MAGCWISVLFYWKAISAKTREPNHGMWEFIQWLSANQNSINFVEVEQFMFSLSKLLQVHCFIYGSLFAPILGFLEAPVDPKVVLFDQA